MPQLPCTECGRTFTRTEHLTRHLRSHTREKPFSCSMCGKSFSRSDILHRHQAAHQPPGMEKATRVATATFRACIECANRRVKCSGGIPCQRCSARLTNCQYPTKRKRKNATGNDSTQTSHRQTGAFHHSSVPEEPVGSFSSADTSMSPVSPVFSTEAPMSQGLLEQEIQQSSWQSDTREAHSEEFEPLSRNRDPLAMVVNGNSVQAVWTENSVGLPSDLNETQYGPFINAGVPMFFPPEQQFNELELSSINWLPPGDPMLEEWNAEHTQLSRMTSIGNVNILPGSSYTNNPATLPRLVQGTWEYDRQLENTSPQTSSPHNQPSPAATELQSRSAGSTQTPDTISTYYVDGAGAREAVTRRSRRRSSLSRNERIEQLHTSNDVNEMSHSSTPDTGTISKAEYSHSWVTSRVYADILLHTEQSGVDIPSLGRLRKSIELYFDRFHCVFPLLRKIPISHQTPIWMLILSMAAVGMIYERTTEPHQMSAQLHQFLHRYLQEPITSNKSGDERLIIVQAQILNVLGMFHSGDNKLMALARSGWSSLVSSCHDMELLRPNRRSDTNTSWSIEAQQRLWVTEQMRIRAGYFIWMLDCTLAYESDFRPKLQLLDAEAQLPCSEYVCENVESTWSQICEPKNEPPSLRRAVEVLYMEKKILPSVSELGRILIIHAIYQRSWDVTNYHRSVLSAWTPSANVERVEDFSSKFQTWLPSIPTVSRWRNIACDALDILHWSANSSIAQAAGLEHPTIIHLHLARLILLTPVIKFQKLISCILEKQTAGRTSSNTMCSSEEEESEAQNEILRWAARDQYKARLSIIHAGAIFWNVRRYSYDSPIEPFAIYLSTLVIWAYSTSLQKIAARQRMGTDNSLQAQNINQPRNINTTRDHDRAAADITVPSPQPSEQVLSPASNRPRSPEPEPTFLHIDRPCDDELVQLYVRSGCKMTAFIARVGNISAPGAALGILKEGARNLDGTDDKDAVDLNERGMPPWGLATIYKSRLEALAANVGKVVEQQE